MNDPYKTLGVEPTASDDEVKRAYRDLARKYHPDKYVDNPLSGLAEEKMKEINEAYDIITKQRQNGGSNANTGYSGQSYGNPYSGGGYSSGTYARIRQYIMSGNIVQAEQLLNSVPERDAEWYFLYGAICQRKGWYDEARRNFGTASSMEPSNIEYRQALASMQTSGVYHTNSGFGGGAHQMTSPCDVCSGLLCADCCCECMGGDLIPCC